MLNLYQIIAFSVTTLFTLCAVFCYKTKPNIIIITADDMGWNDVSYHGSDQIPTPNIDALAYNGVILNKHYVQPVCTPSRAALMTGKYPIHTGMQGIPILNTEIRGLPLSEELLPQYLQQLGYSTHLIGKWHLGHYNKRYTPLQRGFNSHLGFLTGYIGYYNHVCCCVLFPEWCGHDMRRNYSTAWDLVGRYATDVFTEEAVSLITSHEGNKPLFLMISHVAPHAGNEGNKLEAPQEEINKFQYIINPNRRTYAAMVSKLDQSVGEVIAALQRKNLLENSIILFLSDNGAANHQFMENWGSNYPLRGEKGTLWEGGIRVPALIWSPLIQANSRIADHLMHISDWLPTLLTAAGGHHLIKNKKLDGVDQWETIINKQVSPRKEVLINIDELNDLNALIYGKFKYIYGTRNIKITSDIKFDHFSNIGVVVDGEKSPEYNISSIIASETWKAINTLSRNINKEILQNIPLLRIDSNIQCHHQIKLPNCRIKKCLFNLDLDPCEQFNLADKYPMLLKFLELLVKTYKLSLVPQELLKTDQRSNPKYFNYTWNSWI